jgi:hypothetical protein
VARHTPRRRLNMPEEDNRANYSQKAAKGLPSGLLDVRGVGLIALARQQGLEPLPSNVYMPRELLEELG